MNEKDLRVAAERLFQWALRHYGDDGTPAARALIADCYAVSQAYLAIAAQAYLAIADEADAKRKELEPLAARRIRALQGSAGRREGQADWQELQKCKSCGGEGELSHSGRECGDCKGTGVSQ